MKYFILLLLFTTSIFGITIKDSLLKIHATLVPKLYLMDHAYKEKTNNDSIVIAIMHNKNDYKNALSLKEKIEAKYRAGLKSYTINTKLVQYSQIEQNNANIYYLFPTNNSNIKSVISKADQNNALTFSYLNSDLKHGVMISLNIGHKVKPILNLEAIKLHNISFRSVLLDISHIYTKSSSNPSNAFESKWFNHHFIYIAIIDSPKENKRVGVLA